MTSRIEQRIEEHENRAKEHLTDILWLLNGGCSMSDTAMIEVGQKIETAQIASKNGDKKK